MLFSNDREALRRFFITSWRKRRDASPLEPLEALVSDVVIDHPEYHPLLEDDRALDRDWLPEEGQTNPFLHLAMHVAIREQLASGQPPGIEPAWQALLARTGDRHHAEHAMLECLGEVMWQAQRNGTEPDVAAYLDCLRRR